MPSTRDVITANLSAYNARDLEAFLASFDPDIEMHDLRSGAVSRGIDDVRARYSALFASSPALHSRILHRSVLGDLVHDHELVTGRAGGDVEILITYEVRDGRIRRVWWARATATGLHIVRAEPADLDTVLELGASTYREHFAAIWSPGGLARYLAGEFDRAAVATELGSMTTTYLLGLAPAPAGFAKLRLDRAVPGDGTGKGVELQKIYVRRAAVGSGLGARLLAAAIDVARAAGAALIWLDVLKTNPHARRFYERHGFRVAGELPFASDLAEHGMWVMTRPTEK
jgi:ribosomal protein S18 acetylase RimI-like enzyme